MVSDLKQQAISLRKKGMTYSEIGSHLGNNVSKGTLSGWFKNLKLTTFQKHKLEKNVAKKLRSARIKSVEVSALKRLEYLERILIENLPYVENLNQTIQKLMLSILYLGEGAKYRGANNLRLGSSDPRIIQLYLRLLSNCYELDYRKIRIRIQCRHDQSPNLLEKYWKKIINIPNVRFYPTYIDSRTKGKPTMKPNYKGVCTIEYFNTRIQLELEILSHLIIDTLIENKVDNSVFVSRWLKHKPTDKISKTGP